MAEFPSFQLQQRTSQVQKQTQTQKLSQQQLLSIKLLAMGSQDLRQEIYDAAARNPALIITRDLESEGVKWASVSGVNSDNILIKSASKAGQEASDNFQKALEESPDLRQTLQEHLEFQFLSTSHSPAEEKLGLKLIWNLDSRGYHILAPVSLLDSSDKNQTEELLERTMKLVQQLDPAGVCCASVQESLFIQAKAREDAPESVLFFLDGNFEILNPPQPAKILKKLKTLGKRDYTEEDIVSALEYIRTLDPYPAREFSSSQNAYIAPDVFVEKDRETGEFVVSVNEETLPVVEISKEFLKRSEDRSRVIKSTEENEKKRSEHRFVMDSVRGASEFLDSIKFRQKTLLLACQQIVSYQKEFFEKGQRYLKPLRQKDVADAIGVHEATVSRMASSKYLRCSQGLFEIGFFFTNAVNSVETTADEKEVPSSKSGVMFELQQILQEHKNDKKPLSDQKLADLLEARGIKIARRTVAKYRSQMNIDSSYIR